MLPLPVIDKKIGIYAIISPSQKVYIGQSWNISERWRAHKKDKGKNPHIYNSFQKHGSSNHLFKVLHELPDDVTQDVLNVYEVFYMEMYKNCGISLMNIREGGSNGKLSTETKEKLKIALTGRKIKATDLHKWDRSGNKNAMYGKTHSEESKRKMAERKIGRKNSKAATQKQVDKISKPIVQYSLDGVFIKEWKSATEAGRTMGISLNVLSLCCRDNESKGKNYTRYGFIWKFKQ